MLQLNFCCTNFCGYEGLVGEIKDVEANSLSEFYSRLTNVQFRFGMEA